MQNFTCTFLRSTCGGDALKQGFPDSGWQTTADTRRRHLQNNERPFVPALEGHERVLIRMMVREGRPN